MPPLSRAMVARGRRLVANEARGGVDRGRQLREAHGPGEQIALALGAAFAVEELPLRFGLDAFGQHGHAEARAQRQHGADDRRGGRILRQPFHEGLVELDLVERKRVQRRQRRVAGAEIVHRNRNAHRLQLAQDVQAPALVGHDGRFRHLHFQAARRKSGLEQDGMDGFGEIVAAELHRRQVDGDGAGDLALGGVAAGGAQRPFAHRHDGSGFLRERNEFRRRDHAALRVPPSHQGFGAADLSVTKRGLQLIMQFEFAAAGGQLQVARQRAAGACGVVHLAADTGRSGRAACSCRGASRAWRC